jgi:hypothetical protein
MHGHHMRTCAALGSYAPPTPNRLSSTAGDAVVGYQRCVADGTGLVVDVVRAETYLGIASTCTPSHVAFSSTQLAFMQSFVNKSDRMHIAHVLSAPVGGALTQYLDVLDLPEACK